jgi:thiosulfate/3-mercaptopyruvate sulfurtransferase
MDVLITAAELARLDPAPVRLDVRWALGDPDGHQHYLDARIPGARYADLETELAAPASREAGRHPLPDLAVLQTAARSWGIRSDSAVVVYDNTGGLAAARAWWLLRWAGHYDVRILDGGLGAWIQSGQSTESGPPAAIEAGDIELSAGHLPTFEADAAAALARTGVLLDSRVGPRYRGEVEPVDAKAGHIPGAVNKPTNDNIGPDGRFRSPDELRQRYADVDRGREIGVYCGSGITAAHEIAALAIIGIDAALYPGSWSQWAGDDARAVATGSLPG